MAENKHPPPRPVSRGDFEIAVICALTFEANAVVALFDHHWDDDGPPYEKAPADPNAYSAGAIGRHNVILAHMPGMGKANGAAGAAHCRSSFPNIKLAIVVGICSVVPFDHDGVEIALGDVIVSDAVVQYDLGRLVPERPVQKDTLLDSLGRPNAEIRSFLAKLRDIRGRKTLRQKMIGYLSTLRSEPELAAGYPGTAHDRLFEAAYHHRRDDMSCDECGCNGPLVPRSRLEQGNQQPTVHFGLIASGDTVMKSGEERDRIAQQKRIVAFEMESAGVWDTLPCVVIKGACDYADSHRSKGWQRYAAATAAACMKAFLDQWLPPVSLPLVQPSVLEHFGGPWFLVPYPRNETFVGRSAVLEKLQQQILKSDSQERVSLFGCGGIGKTQIALEYVYWLQTKHKDMSVFWVHASNPQQFRQSYAFIAQTCRIPGFDDPQVDVLPLVKSWLDRKDRAGWWVMVIDNADDAQLFDPSSKETSDVSGVSRKGGLGHYIPKCAHGSILATTRNQQVGRRLAKGKEPIFVGATDDTESEELIRAHLTGTSATRTNLLTLSSRLNNLPLALVQAATYIEETSITVRKYLQLLASADENMFGSLRDQFGIVGLDPEAPKAVALSWVVTLEQIERQYPLAGELLFFMSILERQGIPLQLLSHYRDRKWKEWKQSDLELRNAIDVLKAYAFVEEDNSGNFGLHRLVQLMTVRWLTRKGKIERFKKDALLTVSYMFPYGTFETRAYCAALLSHANAVLGFGGGSSRDEAKAKASLLHCMAGYYIFEGEWAHAETLSLEAAEIRKRLFGVTHLDTLASMANLASIYRNQGRWGEAEKLEVQVMETVKTKVGMDHPDTLASMANLASTYRSQGRWGEAEKLFVQVVETSRSRIGADHPDTLGSMSNLALTYNDQGRWAEAEKLETQVIEAWRTKLGVDHPNTLSSMANLASIYRNLGRWEEAENLFVQVIETSKKKIGVDHPDTLASMTNLASIYGYQGRLEEVRSLQAMITEARQVVRVHYLPDTSESRQTILDHDSGYASASRLATLSAHSESVFEVVSKPSAIEKHDDAVDLSDELQSLASDDDDIGSQASTETTTEGMSGQALIRKFLCEEPQFRALCEKALTRLSRQRFVENMRRLLKSFHKSLLREAQTEAEKATARLLRSRQGRYRISKQLASYMKLEDEDTNQKELDIDLGSKQRVEIWARSVAVDPKQELDSHDMDEESSTSSSENDFPFISEVEVFLRESTSFRRLQREFMLIFMPRTLRHVLLSIPRKHIWVSQEQDISLSNRVKAWIEDVTLLKWNWWPLNPRKRLLRHSEARVIWRCTCGSVQWEEVSMEQYEFVKKILDYSNEQPELEHWCRGKGKPVLITTCPERIFRQIRSASVVPSSSAAQKYTPSKTALATSSSMHTSSYQSGVAIAAVGLGSNRPRYPQTSSTSQQTQITAPNTATHTDGWILFGVRGGSRILVPSQIPVKGQSTDYSIFQELRKCYRSKRGRIRLWFSIWRLEYCESVKFYRLSLSSMVRDKRELPTHQDYQYQPRPPDAENPPITPHIFQSLFYTCPSPCTRRFPHECIPSRAGSTHLERIPKRKQSFEKDLDSYAWGLEAVFEPCFARVVVYHFFILCGPFAFWMCWLWLHPGDWQNASVPMAVVLGGLSLFWSCAGILTSKEHDRK